MKRVASPGSMHDTGCLGLVHWDDPEGWYGEGGGRRVQDGEHMYTCGGFISIKKPKKKKEPPGLISFRMDLLDLLAVQGTLKSLLQHHNSKTSILQRSDFFKVRLSHPYMTTGKTIALTRWTFVGKVMSLLLNMQSRLVIAFLSRSKRLLISWLQSPSAVILEPKKIKSVIVSVVSPSICYEVIGPDAVILVF